MIRATLRGHSGLLLLNAGVGSLRVADTTSIEFGPRNGRAPVAISKNITPKAKMSDVIDREARACSGDMQVRRPHQGALCG